MTVSPEGKLAAFVIQAVEQFFVQQLVPRAANEAFDKTILLRLAGVDVVPINVVNASPF